MSNRPRRAAADARQIRALPRSSPGLSRSRRWVGVLVAAVGLPLLTAGLVTVRSSLALESMLLIYLLAVVVVAAVGGRAASLLAAVASLLLVDWFLTPPYNTLAVDGRDASIALFVFMLAAALVSITVELGARSREKAQRTRMESRLISRLSSAELSDASVVAVLEQARALFEMTTVALVDPTDDSVLASVGPPPSDLPRLTVSAPNGLNLVAHGPAIFAADQRLLGMLAATASRAWPAQQLAEQAAHAQQLAENDRVRSALLAAVSYDLRTPLAGIKAAAFSLLQDDTSWTREEQHELLLTVDRSADRLTDLISDLLTMSRIQVGAVSVEICPVALDEVVASALLGSGADVDIEVPEDLPLVQVDAGLLERVVANLVDNSSRFSPPGVPVRIHADTRELGQGRGPGAAGAPGVQVRLHIADNGPGIDPSQWDTIFTPFQNLGDDGNTELGLGLAIAHGFTAAMNAKLTPSATPGGGLTMTITLPASPT